MNNPPTQNYIEQIKEQFWLEKAEMFNESQEWLFEECSYFLTSALTGLVKRIEEDVKSIDLEKEKGSYSKLANFYRKETLDLVVELLQNYQSNNIIK